MFTEPTASWHGRVTELRKSAQRRTADAKRRGSISTIDTTPSSARRVGFGRFANVRVDGAPPGAHATLTARLRLKVLVVVAEPTPARQ